MDMKEKILNMSEKVFNEMYGFIKATGEVAVEQGGLLVKEILLFKGVQYSLTAVFLLALFVVALKVGNYALKKKKEDGYSSDWEFVFIPAYLASLLVWVPICYNTIQALKVFLAPRLYLLEYLSDVVKGCSSC